MAVLKFNIEEPTAPPRSHHWVRWSVQDVAVIVDPFTGAYFTEDLPFSAVGSQVGCHACGEPLTDSSVLTSCTGDTDDSLSH